MKFNLKSLTGRIFIGEMVGLFVGIITMLSLPSFGFSIFSKFGIGMLMFFILMGAFIGFLGIFDRHPILEFKMDWYFRGAICGFFFMLMFILLSYENLEVIMSSNLVSWSGLSSPFWTLIDGVFIGLIMAYTETKISGDGPNLPIK